MNTSHIRNLFCLLPALFFVGMVSAQTGAPKSDVRGEQSSSSAKDVGVESQEKGDAEFLEKMCFGYAKKGWEIISSAQQRKLNESAAQSLVSDYFSANDVPKQKILISRFYSGEFKSPEEFATHLQNSCFAEMPPHPNRIPYSDQVAKSCYKQLIFPQYAYAKKYKEKLTEDAAIASIPSTLGADRIQFMTAIIHSLYRFNDPESDANVFWMVYKSCASNVK